MSIFEATPQGNQDTNRLNAAWDRIDVLVTALSLHTLDADCSNTSVIEMRGSATYIESLCDIHTPLIRSSVNHSSIPSSSDQSQVSHVLPSSGTQISLSSPLGNGSVVDSHYPSETQSDTGFSSCTCQKSSLMADARTDGITRLSTGLLYSPSWDERWTEEETAREEGRRVFWTA